ncbi:MAG: hypothetical protein JWN55_1921 [Frankiales bacterium]|nr:hypothetical protein [Frankiales bacterium]
MSLLAANVPLVARPNVAAAGTATQSVLVVRGGSTPVDSYGSENQVYTSSQVPLQSNTDGRPALAGNALVDGYRTSLRPDQLDDDHALLHRS